jgi:hypothetical protein
MPMADQEHTRYDGFELLTGDQNTPRTPTASRANNVPVSEVRWR